MAGGRLGGAWGNHCFGCLIDLNCLGMRVMEGIGDFKSSLERKIGHTWRMKVRDETREWRQLGEKGR